MTRPIGFALGLFVGLLACSAHAEEAAERTTSVELPEARQARGLAALERPTGIAEAGFGWLTLPGAQVCVVRCSRGDTSFEVDVWQLYRQNIRFALGAGLLLGLIPTNDGADETHNRRYMTVEGTARYYPYVGENVEWWVGITGGLVVVSDAYEVARAPTDRALLGPTGNTIRTEGGSIGIAGGPVISLARNFTLGSTLRYGHWFLPDRPAVDALGNQASLNGRNTVFSLGVNLAFRLDL
ncbi:MAG: hypothetical protein QM756_30470 [Polyangiaceae bacterium]